MKRYLMLTLALLSCCLSTVQAAPDPVATVHQFYGWYMRQGGHMWQTLPEEKAEFTQDLFDLLQWGNAHAKLSFDPFNNSQVETIAYKIGKPVLDADTASVPIKLTYAGIGNSTQTVWVLLHQEAGDWRIADFHYDQEGRTWNLKKLLEDSKAR